MVLLGLILLCWLNKNKDGDCQNQDSDGYNANFHAIHKLRSNQPLLYHKYCNIWDLCSASLSPSLLKCTTYGYIYWYVFTIYPYSPKCNTNMPIPHTVHLSFPPWLTLPGCQKDWLSMLQPEGMMSSHHCLSCCLSDWLTDLLLIICLSEACHLGLHLNHPYICLSGWLTAWLSGTHPPIFVRLKACFM